MILISQISPDEHDNSGGHIWRGDEALRGSNAEPHSLVEDDGKKVGNSVGTSG